MATVTSAEIETRARRLLGHPDTRPLTDDQRLAAATGLGVYHAPKVYRRTHR